MCANVSTLLFLSPERKEAPHLTISLGSNNPFRNRALSPTSPKPAPERPRSTNPFLDDNEIASPLSDPEIKSQTETGSSLTGNTAELFVRLEGPSFY
jgi:hypothetical protein